MKKHLATLALAILMGVLGFAISGVAVAAGNEKPPSPPGQDECEHGNSAKPCKEDPQTDKGKDCDAHGNNGGVNEDHCKGEDTTPTETTPTESTPTETTPNDTTPQETVPTQDGSSSSTPPATDSSEPGSTQVPEPTSSDSSQPAPKIVGKPPVAPAVKQAAVLSVTADAPKPTRQAQQAPLTL
jgi:hypothetical protein